MYLCWLRDAWAQSMHHAANINTSGKKTGWLMDEEGFGIGLCDPLAGPLGDETLGLPTYLVSGILTCRA